MIVCTGESLIDFVPEPRGSATVTGGAGGDAAGGDAVDAGLPAYHPVVGGSPFNCAIAAARLGGEVSFISAISTDFFGDEIARCLAADGVSDAYVRRVANPTTLAFVKRAADGSASYAFYTNDSADRALSVESLPQTIPDAALLQVGSISLIPEGEGEAVAQLAEREAERRVVVFDPNIRLSVIESESGYRARVDRILRSATILKTSDEDLSWVYPNTDTKQAAHKALDAGVTAVVVTAGRQGSSVYTAGFAASVEAAPVQVVDTIGAGDSFMAALLVWLDEHNVQSRVAVKDLGRNEWDSALGFSSKVSGIVCTRKGADPPYRSELDP